MIGNHSKNTDSLLKLWSALSKATRDEGLAVDTRNDLRLKLGQQVPERSVGDRSVDLRVP
jgi:hypothetical protein